MDEIPDRDGETAVTFARSVIEGYLADRTVSADLAERSQLTDQRGAFVTLETDGDLRGCIGRPYPAQTGIEAIRESAIGAATEDPRFRPVSASELSEITVEVSVLGSPEPVAVESESVAEHVRIGRDGLIVSNGGRRGLLLPQVPVAQDWTTTEFLRQTCRKAGLPGDCWRDGAVTVERFTANVFGETVPDGPVERIDLGEAALA
ncbi:MAG: AmmeMemoRadiSam system protein A [Halobacteriota archaeon]